MRFPASPLLSALLVAGGLSLSLPAFAGGMTLSGSPKVSFFAVGSPGFLDIEGVSKKLTVTDDGTTLVFTVPVESLDTGIELRDDHMKEKYMEAGTYPDLVIKLPKASVTWPGEVGAAATGKVAGSFVAHGVEKPVEIEYSVKKSKTGYRVTGKFAFDASQHGIGIPAYLGVTVDPKMRAEATLDLADAQ